VRLRAGNLTSAGSPLQVLEDFLRRNPGASLFHPRQPAFGLCMKRQSGLLGLELFADRFEHSLGALAAKTPRIDPHLADWQLLVRRYMNNPTVVAVDLRNEPHTGPPGPWSVKTYLHQGATRGPYKGQEDPASDWHLAAQRGGDAVLAVNPHLLIFVEGVQLYPSARWTGGMDSYWWGSILTPVMRYPVVLKVAHQLVYSPHDWGPWKWNMSWFHHMTYASMQHIWHNEWSFILDHPENPNAAPIWLGEFGTCSNNPQCVDKQRGDNQAVWFHLLLRYRQDNPTVGWSFFALDGTNSNDHVTNNGVLNAHWDQVANVDLQRDLSTIQPHP